MAETPLGIFYPESGGHTRLWEYYQQQATDVDGLMTPQVFTDSDLSVSFRTGWGMGGGYMLFLLIIFLLPPFLFIPSLLLFHFLFFSFYFPFFLILFLFLIAKLHISPPPPPPFPSLPLYSLYFPSLTPVPRFCLPCLLF